jgi:hypothetical protein
VALFAMRTVDAFKVMNMKFYAIRFSTFHIFLYRQDTNNVTGIDLNVVLVGDARLLHEDFNKILIKLITVATPSNAWS